MPGFITNRILMPYINEAAYALHEDIMTREDIDKTMKLATNVVMGPLAMADFIGLDTVLASLTNLSAELNAAKYQPCPLLVNLVNAGHLGRKTGQGFYKY